jgi:hypothetical protein
LVTNKLLLAFKNKPNFLENIVMNAQPSIISILNNIKKQMKERGFADIKSLEKNKEDYVKQMKKSPNVSKVGNIIVQYGGGYMVKPGSYDRYTPFKNNPEADFLVIAWPLGLVQASCNPFKKERQLKGVNLGEVKDEVLSKWEGKLKEKQISLSTIKWVSETSVVEGSVGFTFKDFAAIYGNKFKNMDSGKDILTEIGYAMNKHFGELSEDEKELLDIITVSAWDIIESNSGGHKCITNISGLNYLGRSTRPPKGKKSFGDDEDAPYVKFVKMVQAEFVKVLQNKIG